MYNHMFSTERGRKRHQLASRKRSLHRLLVFSVMLIVLTSQVVLVAAQNDIQEPDSVLNIVCPDEEKLGGLLETLKTEHPGHENPPIQGLRWHRHDLFSFFVPVGWLRSDWDDGRIGVLYTPDPRDPLTVFSVEVNDLEMVIALDDLDRLDAAFMEVIDQLPEGEISSHDKAIVGELMQLDYQYTFREDCVMRKRWVRMLYQGGHETTLIAQGATLDLYDYWLPWFFEAMATAQVHYQKPTIESLESGI